MVIEKIRVENYHSIEDETLDCEDLTALVGRNGSGKSSFLRAMELFYSQSPKIDAEDYYNRDTKREIIISITFKDLPEEAKDLFGKYVQNEKLMVQRVFSINENKVSNSYHGLTEQNPDFKDIRLASKATDAKEIFLKLKKKPKYVDLAKWKNQKEALVELTRWEESHKDECVLDRDDGNFFGFKSVASGYLGRFTKFLFIPAIRDAAEDAVDGPSSPITELMDLVVRSILASKPELDELKKNTQQQFSALMAPTTLTELDDLANTMTETLQQFVPETSIEMMWQKLSQIDFPLPKAETKLNQDGYSSPVNRAGHGLQRAFIITALQHLVKAQQQKTIEGAHSILPVLVLAIEEPELYQHPNSQHHLSKILIEIAKGKTPGVAERTQVIYGTHSPHFVGLDRINQIRLLRKVEGKDQSPKTTKVVKVDLELIAQKIYEVNNASGPMYTADSLAPRLQSIMTSSLNEGFFADVIVLVEGEDDVAAIIGYANALGKDLISLGISVIPCHGKSSLDRPSVIFKSFDIPTYVVWDGDKNHKDTKKEGKTIKENHTILRIVEETTEDFPQTVVDENFACFEINLETTLKLEIGEDKFEELLKQAQAEFQISNKDFAIKNPRVISYVVENAISQDKKSKTLEMIVEKITNLR